MRIACVSVAFAAVVLISTAGTTLAWNTSSFSSSDEQLLFSLTNHDRASAGLNALVNDSYLHKEAEWRAKDMATRNYWSHEIPPGNDMVFAYMDRDGYCYKVAGENIALSSYDDDVATSNVEVGFMNSPAHRENILGKWTRLGVGAYKAANGNKLYAVLFSIPCSTPKATPKPTLKPTPKPTPRPTDTATPEAGVLPSPSASPDISISPIPSEMAGATESPATDNPLPSAGPAAPANATTLRVRERPVSQGPIDSLFHSLFGGLFGW